MNGPEDAAGRILAHIAAHLPAELAALEARLALDPGALKVPKFVPPRDPKLAVDDFPAITVAVVDTPALRRVDVADDGTTVYEVRYTVRPFVFARAKTEEAASLARHRYVLALRETLLARPTVDPDEGPVIDETTWRESFSDTGTAGQAGAIAAAFVEFAATMLEYLSPTVPPYTPTDTEIDVPPLPPAPPRTPPPNGPPFHTVTLHPAL